MPPKIFIMEKKMQNNKLQGCICMEKIDLNGEWKLYGFSQEDDGVENPENLGNANSIPAIVPGNVELDLANAGILPENLFFGDNIHELKPYELYEWWYEKEFGRTRGVCW